MATTPYTGQTNNQNFFGNPPAFPAPFPPFNFPFTISEQDDVSITGGNLNDTVKLLANVSEFTVVAGLGADSVLFDGQLFNSSIDSGDGNDSINAGGLTYPTPANFLPPSVSVFNTTVSAGLGDDSVFLKGRVDATTADGGEGDDQILVVTGGNDSVEVLSNSSLFGGIGDDFIGVFGNDSAQVINSTLAGGVDDDFIDIEVGFIENSSVAAGVGDDVIEIAVNELLNSTIDGQQGNDLLLVEADFIRNSQILSGQGTTGNGIEVIAGNIENTLVRTQGNDDSIGLFGLGLNQIFSNSTVNASSGNDSVRIEAFDISDSSVNAGTGNDTVVITGDASTFVENSTISAAGGNDSVVIAASIIGTLVNGAAGNDSILVEGSSEGSVQNSTIDGGTNNDSIAIKTGFINPSQIIGGNGDDVIDLLIDKFVEKTLVDGGFGDDSIGIVILGNPTVPGALAESVVTGGSGEDSVSVLADLVLSSGIAGGANNDTVEVSAVSISNSTVNGQSGNDLLVINADPISGSTLFGGGSVIGSQFSDTIFVKAGSIANSSIDTSTGGIGNLIAMQVVTRITDSTVVSNGGSDTIAIAMSGAPSVIGGTSIAAGNGDNAVSVLGSVGLDGLTFANSTLTSGSGDDSVELQAQKILGSTVNLGDGENTLLVDMLGGAGNMINPSSFITGSGNDSVRIAGEPTVLTISDSTVSTGEGNDTVNITAKSLSTSLVDGGDGDNLVLVSADFIANSTVVTGSGNDTIGTPLLGSLENSTVDSGAGDDLLALVVANVTNSQVKAGEGNDTLQLVNSDILGSLVDAGEGNNVVLMNADPAFSPDFLIALGNRNLENSTISSGAGNDSIVGVFELISNSTVSSTGGDDSVALRSLTDVAGLTVGTGAGADLVLLNAPGAITASSIDTGSEADTIAVGASLIDNTTVSSGSGADLITMSAIDIRGSSVTAGSENDSITVSLSGTLFRSTVTGNGGDDLIQIFGNVSESSVAGGSYALGDELRVNRRNDLIVVNAPGAIFASTFEGGFGNDSIALAGPNLDNNLLRSTEGDNTFFLTGASINGSSIIGGLGTDLAAVNATANISKLLVDLGARNDSVVIVGPVISDLKVVTDDTPLSTAGNDFVNVDAGIISLADIRTFAGNDTIRVFGVNANALVIDAGSGNDSVEATGSGLLSNAVISGGAGNDSVLVNYAGGIFTSTIDGGFGSNDTISVFSAAVLNSSLVDGLNGDDVIVVRAPAIVASTIVGGTGKDSVTIDATNINGTRIELGDDGDVVSLNAIAFSGSTLLAGGGNDSLDINVGNFGSATVDAGTGNDTVDLRGVTALIAPTAITANVGNDLVLVADLLGSFDSDLLGGDGNDTLFIDGSSRTVALNTTEVREFEYYWLGAGNTLQVNAEAAVNQVLAGFGSTINVIAKNSAGADADVNLSGMLVSSTWVPGSIQIDASTAGTGRVLNGHIQVSDPLFNGLADVSIIGSAFSDTITGSLGEDTVLAGAGADIVDGKGGADSLLGEAGNDSLLGGTGNDTVLGGADNDTLVGGEGDDSLLYGTGSNNVLGGIGNDFIGSGEVVLITDPQFLSGEEGNDILLGEGGNDTLLGGADNDSLLGFAGNDSINGDAGNDTLVGGTGADRLNSGSGVNRFVWAAGDSVNATSFVNASGVDLIYNAGDRWTFNNGVDIVTGDSLVGDTFAVGIGSNSTALNGGAGAGFQDLLNVTFLGYQAITDQANFFINGFFDGTNFEAANSGVQFTHTLISQGLSGAGANRLFATTTGSGAASFTFLVDWKSPISSNPLTANNFVANV